VIALAVGSGCTISSVVPFLVAAVARTRGIDPEPLLRAAGLELEAHPSADEHVDIERYLELWRRLVKVLPDPGFPLQVASTFQLEDHELFGFLAISCETLGQAYERTATYRALYSVGARWELQLDPGATRLIWYPWPGDPCDVGYRAAMDFAVADMANAIHHLGSTGPRPTAVRLVHDSAGGTAAFAAHYGVAPTFASPLYELVYGPDLATIRVRTFNSRLRDYFDAECRQLLDKLGTGTSMVEQVRKKLVGAMDGGETSIETIAKALGVSPRSLQRRLADEGTRYNDLLADIRAEFAKRYLARGTVSASEVAFLIGFTEPPAFFKAFKRWTGMTPREFQRGTVAA
jgi:AraC-like DNA-binding protein